MNTLEIGLKEKVKYVFKALYEVELEEDQIQIQQTRKDFVGDRTLVVFPLLRWSKSNPEETAKAIGESMLQFKELIDSYQVVKGFLNFKLRNSFWLDQFKEIEANESFGFAPEKSRGRIMIEYSSPNTNKPLHLGHLRNNFIGNSVARILKAHGHEVLKVQIINDRGIHICKSMLAWQKFGNGETPESSGIKGDHLVGKYYVEFDRQYKIQVERLIKGGMADDDAKREAPLMKEAQEMLRNWEAEDQEIRALWKTMNRWVYKGFESTYETMKVDFDKLYYESDTFLIGKEKVEKHIGNKYFYKKEDGSVWIKLDEENLDDKLLLRSDGTSVYMTQDIGTAIIREEDFHCDQYYYVVGNEQDYHFKVLSIILTKMGFDWAKGVEHISYGMVDLPSGKMKSREGTVVDADDLIIEMKTTAGEISKDLGKLDSFDDAEKDNLYGIIGLGALKYFILKVDPQKRMLFDPKESVDFNGNTGPFIQYAYTRIQSILRKLELERSVIAENVPAEELDTELIKKLVEFPQVIEESALQKSPSLIANYIYDLVKAFNHFYQNTTPIIKEEDAVLKSFRIGLINQVGRVIEKGCYLLGMEVPERM